MGRGGGVPAGSEQNDSMTGAVRKKYHQRWTKWAAVCNVVELVRLVRRVPINLPLVPQEGFAA